MKFLQKIKQKVFSIGITENELRLIFVLILILFVGLALKLLKANCPEYEKFNYTCVDSLSIGYESKIDTNNNALFMQNDTVILSTLNEIENISKKKILPPDKKININEASESELAELPNIGTKTATTIIKYRTKNGKFKSIKDIMKVNGIGQKKFDKMKNNIIVENE